MSLADARLSAAADELARYGYGLTGGNVMTRPDGGYAGVTVSLDGPRVRVHRMPAGADRARGGGKVLWSGPVTRIGEFLERFWFAEPLDVTR